MATDDLKSRVVDCIGKAARAPSSHNTQPWRFQLREQSGVLVVKILAQGSLRLVETDKDGRELLMSCGAAIETFFIALDGIGIEYSIEFEGVDDAKTKEAFELCIVTITGQSTEIDESYKALANEIERRVTYRGPFAENKPITDEEINALKEAAQIEGCWLHIIPQDRKTILGDMIFDANDAQWHNPKWRSELAHWIRPASAGDGLNMTSAFLAPLKRFAISAFAFVGNSVSRSDRALALSAEHLAVLGCRQASYTDWVNAGRALQRALLVASSKDIFASYFNQPLQVKEFSYIKVSEAIDKTDGSPALILRLGRVDEPENVRRARSARKPLESILL